MFRNVLRMELKRSCSPLKLFVAIVLITVIFIASVWDTYISVLLSDSAESRKVVGSIQILEFALGFDRFKVIIVLICSALHTMSFCSDDKSRYLRMILSRTDAECYTMCRFFANAIAILLVSIASFVLFVIVLRPLVPVVGIGGNSLEYQYYYVDLITYCPWGYVLMMGIQFGIVVAACSSIGLLVSGWQPNAFVSVAISGMVFYVSASYIPLDSIFNVLWLISMDQVLPKEWMVPWFINYAWGLLYPVIIICICMTVFYRRIKWRVVNGNI